MAHRITAQRRQTLTAALALLAALLATNRAQAAGPTDVADRPQYPATGPAPPAQPERIAPTYGADGSVQRTTYQSDADFRDAANPNPRTGAEPMPLDPSVRNSAGAAGVANTRRPALATPSSLPAIFTMFLSLAVVLGLFLGMTWLLRRGLPKGTRLLSSEVVEVLGRAPLAPRQQMHVIRFGNRLLLVSVTSAGAETLAEITDPAEVDRLAGICQQSHAHSATNSFRQIFRQLSEGRAGREIERAKTAAAAARNSNANRPTAAEDDDV